MKLIINEDDSHYYYQKPGKPAEGITAFIDQYENTCVGELFLCVNAMRASYDSKVFPPIWKDYDPDNENHRQYATWVNNAKELNTNGRNLYCDWISRCRQKNIAPWISMRMNDIHNVDNELDLLHSDFWRNRPERRRVTYRFASWPDRSLDYGREDVFQYSLDMVREIAGMYDMDGLELDWMRFGYHFRPGFEQEGVKILNRFMRETRKILDEAERGRGHKIALAARVPSCPETALGLGYDAAAWADEGLVDLLIVTPFFTTIDTDMPIEIWKRLLKGTSTKLAAGLEILVSPYPGAKQQPNGFETLRGTAWSYLHRGVDAVYLFNYMHSGGGSDGVAELFSDHNAFSEHEKYAEMINEIGDIQAMRGKNRRHVVTYRDTWAPGEAKGYLLPVTLDGWADFRIHIGEAPVDGQNACVVIGVKDGAAPDVWVNGTKCEEGELPALTEPIPSDTPHAYKIAGGILHDGYNLVETNGGKGRLTWVEICITKTEAV